MDFLLFIFFNRETKPVWFSPQIFYKDDLNWLKGIGCYAWDTPEILRVKHAGDLQSEVSNSTCFECLKCSPSSHYFCLSCYPPIRANDNVLVFLFQNKYRAKGVEAFKDYSVVTDTPVYETAKKNAVNLSDVSDFIFLTVLAYHSPCSSCL